MRTMCRLSLVLLVLVVATSAVPQPSRSETDCPSWRYCQTPPRIDYPTSLTVVGQNSGVPDSRGEFRVVVRDCDGNPCVGSNVSLEFGQQDIRICDYQGGGEVFCEGPVIIKYTDAAGVAVFHVVGEADRSRPWEGWQHASLTVNHKWMTQYPVAAFDLDGGGVSVTDLTAWLQDWGSGINYARGDYDHDGVLSLRDYSILLSVWGAGTSANGCGTYAPGAALCP